ncbi:MAG TPA: hypothetical protein VGD43_02055 [Micromonospora sp.]
MDYRPQGAPPPGAHAGHRAHAVPPGGAVSRAGTIAVVAHVLCPVLVILGQSIPENDTMLWAEATAWAIFAALASVVQLAPALGRNTSRPPERTWTIAAAATAALLVYWVLIVLPGVGSTVGFVLTLGVAAAVVGCWLSPGRRL